MRGKKGRTASQRGSHAVMPGKSAIGRVMMKADAENMGGRINVRPDMANKTNRSWVKAKAVHRHFPKSKRSRD